MKYVTEEKQQNSNGKPSLEIIFRKKFFTLKKLYSVLKILFFSGAILLVFLFVGFWYLYRYVAPDVNFLDGSRISQTTVLYDRTGQHVLYELFGEANRKIIKHEDISDFVRLATVAAEDDAFYRHHGIDILAVFRALWINVQKEGVAQGGSTITMQLARNVFLTRERTFERKIAESVLAVKMENRFSKEEILDWYLNIIPYGSNAYGIEAASRTFFEKPARELSLDEAALLAALPKATTDYSPYGGNVKNLEFRQKYILNRMLELKMVSEDKVREALSVDTLEKIRPISRKIIAPHFVFYVIQELEKQYGKDFLDKGGLKIYTTLDRDMQRIAEEKVREGALSNKANGATNGALVAIDPKSGEILAMVGSKDYFDRTIDGQVNVTTRPRQPGSVFKPFAYARAFELGFQPETLVYDVRTNFGPDGSGRDYIPNNYDGHFHGVVSLRQALANSLNIPAVKTLYLAGIDGTIDLAKRLGITTLNDRHRYGLSLVLGGAEITLLDGTNAFSVFAADGTYHPAHGILRSVGNDGKALSIPEARAERVLDVNVARKISSILSDDGSRSLVFGSGSALHVSGRTVAAKSGTTQDFHDGWTIGFTPSLAVGVWVGNNNNKPMRSGSDGVNVAAPIWNAYMKSSFSSFPERFPEEKFPEYEKADIPIPMISGLMNTKTVFYDIKSGKKISESSAKKKSADRVRSKEKPIDQHDVLYYLMQNEGAWTFPRYDESMMFRWESGIQGEDSQDDVSQGDEGSDQNQGVDSNRYQDMIGV